MRRPPLSPAGAGLLRALLSRAAADRDRILLTGFRSTDWQSLTFIGERHCFELRAVGPEAEQLVARICDGLEDAEFDVRGHLVADIAVSAQRLGADGAMIVAIEALTVAVD